MDFVKSPNWHATSVSALRVNESLDCRISKNKSWSFSDDLIRTKASRSFDSLQSPKIFKENEFELSLNDSCQNKHQKKKKKKKMYKRDKNNEEVSDNFCGENVKTESTSKKKKRKKTDSDHSFLSKRDSDNALLEVDRDIQVKDSLENENSDSFSHINANDLVYKKKKKKKHNTCDSSQEYIVNDSHKGKKRKNVELENVKRRKHSTPDYTVNISCDVDPFKNDLDSDLRLKSLHSKLVKKVKEICEDISLENNVPFDLEVSVGSKKKKKKKFRLSEKFDSKDASNLEYEEVSLENVEPIVTEKKHKSDKSSLESSIPMASTKKKSKKIQSSSFIEVTPEAVIDELVTRKKQKKKKKKHELSLESCTVNYVSNGSAEKKYKNSDQDGVKSNGCLKKVSLKSEEPILDDISTRKKHKKKKKSDRALLENYSFNSDSKKKDGSRFSVEEILNKSEEQSSGDVIVTRKKRKKKRNRDRLLLENLLDTSSDKNLPGILEIDQVGEKTSSLVHDLISDEILTRKKRKKKKKSRSTLPPEILEDTFEFISDTKIKGKDLFYSEKTSPEITKKQNSNNVLEKQDDRKSLESVGSIDTKRTKRKNKHSDRLSLENLGCKKLVIQSSDKIPENSGEEEPIRKNVTIRKDKNMNVKNKSDELSLEKEPSSDGNMTRLKHKKKKKIQRLSLENLEEISASNSEPKINGKNVFSSETKTPENSRKHNSDNALENQDARKSLEYLEFTNTRKQISDAILGSNRFSSEKISPENSSDKIIENQNGGKLGNATDNVSLERVELIATKTKNHKLSLEKCVENHNTVKSLKNFESTNSGNRIENQDEEKPSRPVEESTLNNDEPIVNGIHTEKKKKSDKWRRKNFVSKKKTAEDNVSSKLKQAKISNWFQSEQKELEKTILGGCVEKLLDKGKLSKASEIFLKSQDKETLLGVSSIKKNSDTSCRKESTSTPIKLDERKAPSIRYKNQKDLKKLFSKYEFTESVVYEETESKDDSDYVYDFEILKDLKVCLPWPVPELHTIETRVTNSPTAPQLLQIAALKNVTVKNGKFTKQEDDFIIKNWKDFCKGHGLKEDPIPFLSFFSPSKKLLMPIAERLNFVSYLAHGLDNRLLCSVYRRFKRLYCQSLKRNGRYTKEEDEQIIHYIKTTNSTTPFSDLAEILKRNRISLEQRTVKLANDMKSPIKPVRWNRTKIQDFMKHLVDITKVQFVDDLQNMEIDAEKWNELSGRLNIPALKLRQAWRQRIYSKIFMDRNVLTRKLKTDLITFLLSKDSDDWRAIDWPEVANKFSVKYSGVTSYQMNTILKTCVRDHVPKELQKDLKSALNFLNTNVIQTKALRDSQLKAMTVVDLRPITNEMDGV